MNTYKSNLGLINKHTVPVLLEWLAKWEVPYDEILFGKPWPRKKGFYIDDRAVRPDEFLNMTEDEIQTMLGQ
ncbi:capsular biosynthesis protein, partial [Pseudomonas sp. MWU13-2625]